MSRPSRPCLRAAVGAGPGQGARGAIAARQSALDASQARLLAAVRSDSRIGPTARYSVFRSVTELRDDDPDEGAFDALLALIRAMEQAHAALGAGGTDADAKVVGLRVRRAAAARLQRGEPARLSRAPPRALTPRHVAALPLPTLLLAPGTPAP